MTDALILDILLVILLVGYIVYGFVNGLSRSLFVIAGVVAGAIAAYFVVPIVTGWIPWVWLRPGATIAATVLLVLAGHALGSAVGRGVRSGIERTALSGLDRLLGAVLTGIAAALIASVVGASVGQLGVPVLSQAIAGSSVLRSISTLTPDPVEAWVAQLRGVVAASGIPVISDALGGANPEIPQIDTGSAALDQAAQSVVRITGNAYACGVSQSGSGFVVAAGRIITNAHVVAGVSEPVVQSPSGQAVAGTVVYFDPVGDLAVISAPGLEATPLPLGVTASADTDAAIMGYPYGGPFSVGAATVLKVSDVLVDDIYGTGRTLRNVYTLAADVRQGNSGGPLLGLDGTVIGVIFATSAEATNVGYAVTMAELDAVAAAAPTLSATVSTGDCIRG